MVKAAGKTAIITIDGSLVNRGAWIGQNMCTGLVSYEGISAQINEAVADPGIENIVLDINSYGGEASGMSALAGKIKAATKRKHVVAVINDVAASAGYGLASGADEIVVSPTSIVGSIGVVSGGFGFDQALARLGIARRLRIAGANNRIEALIQAFLWLAREPRRAEELQTMTLQPLLQRVLLDLRRAGGDADDVQLHVGADLPFEGEPLCAEIVLRNLVDNALRHRGDGPVTIHVDGELRIVNTLPDGPTPAGSSHGLGLGIARDLCRRFGWRLLVTQQDGRHTAAVRFAAAGD
jgi:hypothetical protein